MAHTSSIFIPFYDPSADHFALLIPSLCYGLFVPRYRVNIGADCISPTWSEMNFFCEFPLRERPLRFNQE